VPSTSAARRMSAFCSEVRRTATRSVLVATNALCAYRAYRSIQADALHRSTAPTVGATGVGRCRPISPTSSGCWALRRSLDDVERPGPLFQGPGLSGSGLSGAIGARQHLFPGWENSKPEPRGSVRLRIPRGLRFLTSAVCR
jgi:hypothetical protein